MQATAGSSADVSAVAAKGQQPQHVAKPTRSVQSKAGKGDAKSAKTAQPAKNMSVPGQPAAAKPVAAQSAAAEAVAEQLAAGEGDAAPPAAVTAAAAQPAGEGDVAPPASAKQPAAVKATAAQPAAGKGDEVQPASASAAAVQPRLVLGTATELLKQWACAANISALPLFPHCSSHSCTSQSRPTGTNQQWEQAGSVTGYDCPAHGARVHTHEAGHRRFNLSTSGAPLAGRRDVEVPPMRLATIPECVATGTKEDPFNVCCRSRAAFVCILQ